MEISSVQPKNEAMNLYAVNDCVVINGDLQYRLKIADNDGSVRNSNIITIRSEQSGSNVYPNPVISRTTVSLKSRALLISTASLINNEGQTIRQFKITALQFELDKQQQPPGIY